MLIQMAIEETKSLFFTADHHFGHENIIKFCKRPFEDVQEMDAVLIDKWNEVVPPNGIVFHLGDFSLSDWSTVLPYFRLLNGRIHILRLPWHHDRRWLAGHVYGDCRSASGHRVEILPPMVVLEIEQLTSQYPLAITLCHYPVAEWDRKHHGGWCLHGHSHGNYRYRDDELALDVGVDVCHYTPISFTNLAAVMKRRGWGGTVDG